MTYKLDYIASLMIRDHPEQSELILQVRACLQFCPSNAIKNAHVFFFFIFISKSAVFFTENSCPKKLGKSYRLFEGVWSVSFLCFLIASVMWTLVSMSA